MFTASKIKNVYTNRGAKLFWVRRIWVICKQPKSLSNEGLWHTTLLVL